MKQKANKAARFIASMCIKLLSVDSIRTWFVVNVLREVEIDDVIKLLKENNGKMNKCPKCGHEF